MHFFYPVKRIIALCFCLAVVFFSSAQSHQFRFFPIKELSFQQQAFFGNIGSHFFLQELTGRDGLELYIYDTTSQTGTKKSYVFPRQLLTVLFYERSVLFISIAPDKEGTTFHLLELDGEGNVLMKKEGLLAGFRRQVRFITSADKKHLVFYQYERQSDDSLLIQGSLVGRDGHVQDQLAYTFKRNRDLDAQPETFVDNSGNIYVLVFDKFSNYRLSSALTVNTIPFGEEQIVSETFNFDKVKVRNMRIFQNTECNCMQAEGMYVDGTVKTNRGIFSIRFPFGKMSDLSAKFIPFTNEMIKEFKRNFFTTEEVVKDSMILQDVIYSTEGSFAIMRLDASMLGLTQIPRAQSPTDNFLPQLFLGSHDRNAPKLVCLKLGKDESFDWYAIRPLDVYTFTRANYFNRSSLISGEKDEILLTIYQEDAKDGAFPVLVTIKDGKQVTEKFPEQRIMFSPFQFLEHGRYASLYVNNETGVGGILLISSK